MVEDNFGKDEDKDFGTVTNKRLQQQAASHSKESVSDHIQSSIKILAVGFQALSIITCAFNRCRKMIQFVGYVASCKGTLILLDLECSAHRHRFLQIPQ